MVKSQAPRSKTKWALGLALAGLLLGGAARAEDKPKQAVLLAEWLGPIEEAERIDLLATFAAALSSQGYTLVDDIIREQTLSGDKRLSKCIDTNSCKFELADRLNADLMVVAMIAHDPGAKGKKPGKQKWKVALTLLPLDVRRQGSDGDRECSGCTEAQAASMVTSLIGETFSSEKKKPRATLIVHSKPDGAAVRLDGDDMGVTDFRHHIYSGPHALEVQLGDQKVALQLDTEADSILEFDADLASGKIEKRVAVAAVQIDPLANPGAAAVEDQSKKKPVYKRWWPWTIAAAVVVVAAAGVTVGILESPRGAPSCSECGDGLVKF